MGLNYLLLNLAVLAVLSIYIYARRDWTFDRAQQYTLGVLLVLTAIFDSLIIAANIVGYDHSQTLSIFIGKAPIEDFAYTVAAVILIPYLWRMLGDTNE